MIQQTKAPKKEQQKHIKDSPHPQHRSANSSHTEATQHSHRIVPLYHYRILWTKGKMVVHTPVSCWPNPEI